MLFERRKVDDAEDLPASLKQKANIKKQMQCVSVVKKQKKEWLSVLQEAFRKKMNSLKKDKINKRKMELT